MFAVSSIPSFSTLQIYAGSVAASRIAHCFALLCCLPMRFRCDRRSIRNISFLSRNSLVPAHSAAQALPSLLHTIKRCCCVRLNASVETYAVKTSDHYFRLCHVCARESCSMAECLSVAYSGALRVCVCPMPERSLYRMRGVPCRYVADSFALSFSLAHAARLMAMRFARRKPEERAAHVANVNGAGR